MPQGEEQRMIRSVLNRRQVLESSGKAALGAAALTGAGVVFSTAGGWALSTQALSGNQAATLLRFVFLLFPYDKIGDEPYVAVLDDLDKKATVDSGFKDLLHGGCAALNKAKGDSWLKLPEVDQVAAMKAIEKAPFFRVVRYAAIDGIYNDRKVWKMIGYGGSAIEKGGYRNNTREPLSDIDWLPKH
jgi:hypothetical protein